MTTSMTRERLEELYALLCELLESCTRGEAEAVRDSIAVIKAIIHKKMAKA